MKPKLPAQFKAAEENGVPFAVVLGEEEVANGQVKIKEMGLPEGNPEKEGVLVPVEKLVNEVRSRLARKARVDAMVHAGLGKRVVGGIRGEPEKAGQQEIPSAEEQALSVVDEEASKADEERTAEEDGAP